MERVYHPMSQWLLRQPDTPILRHEGRTITVEQLSNEVCNLYQYLNENTAQSCALFFQNSAHFIVALLAVLHAGKTPILLGHHNIGLLPEPQYNYDLLLTDNENVQVPNCWYTPNYKYKGNGRTELANIRSETKIIFFTSGSSGVPKRVEKSVNTMDLEAKWLAELWQNQFNATYIRRSVSHQHLYGMTFCVWLPLCLGYQIDCAPIEFSEQLTSSEPYIFITSPAFLQFIDRQLSAPNWSFVVSAGGKLESSLAENILSWSNQPVHEIYGSTETGVIAHCERLNAKSYWTLFPEVTLKTQDKQHYVLCSPLISPLKTLALEDKLSVAEDGRFTLQGRIDKIIKIGEKRISINLIESRVSALPGVVDVAVVPIQLKTRTYLGAVVVIDFTINQSRNSLFSHWRTILREHIDPIAIPRFWRIVSAIPMNQQSKRSWSVLRELFDVTN